MERCPNCRARYESGDSCRRCGMDLGSLLALERAVDGQIALALGQFARGEVPAGRQTLAKARKLHPTPMTDHLIGFAQHLADAPERSDRATPEPPCGDFGPSTPVAPMAETPALGATDQAETAESAATPAGAATHAIHEVNSEDRVTDGAIDHPPESVGTRIEVTRADLVRWVPWLLIAQAALIAFLIKLL